MKNDFPKKTQEIEFDALGTHIFVQVVLNNQSVKQAVSDFAEIREIYIQKEKILSRFDQQSELVKINSELGIFHEASGDILYLAKKSLKYYKMSDELFDPRVIDVLEKFGYDKDFKEIDSSTKEDIEIEFTKRKLEDDLIIENGKIKFLAKMDFAGIAKGWITDQVADFLVKKGWENFLVDSGGDMFARGNNLNGEKWNLDIEGIAQEMLSIKISNQGIATSGITRRKWQAGKKTVHHLVNPKKPENFSFDLRTVTAICKNTEEADFWAKVLFLKGLKGGLQLAEKEKIKAFFLDYNGNFYITPGTQIGQ